MEERAFPLSAKVQSLATHALDTRGIDEEAEEGQLDDDSKPHDNVADAVSENGHSSSGGAPNMEELSADNRKMEGRRSLSCDFQLLLFRQDLTRRLYGEVTGLVLGD